MFQVEVYAAVRRCVLREGHSRREAARVFGLSRDTIARMCRFFGSTGLSAKQIVGEAEAGTADAGDRCDSGR